jgi:hypothetical protein
MPKSMSKLRRLGAIRGNHEYEESTACEPMRLGAVGGRGLIITGTRESGPARTQAPPPIARSSIVASTLMGSEPATLLNSSEFWNARFTNIRPKHVELFFRSGRPALRVL